MKQRRCGLPCERNGDPRRKTKRHKGKCWFKPGHKGEHVCTLCIKLAFERALGRATNDEAVMR